MLPLARRRWWTGTRWCGLRSLARGLALLAVPLLAGAGCENPLDVENPNNLIEDDLNNPAAVSAVVNGSQGTVSGTLNGMLATHSSATGELRPIGSFDAWRELARGNLGNPGNLFTQGVYSAASESRYMADRAVAAAETFDAEGSLGNRNLLARAHLYAGITYTMIPDFYENFVIPDAPTEPAPAVGEENMGQLYDRAIQHLTDGLAVARELGNATLEARLLAQRARARQSKAIWGMLNPPGSSPGDPLVDDAQAVQDAQAALEIVGPSSDWEFQFTFTPTTVNGPTSAAFQVNERGGLAIGESYVIADLADPSKVQGVRIQDPIDEIPDPRIQDKLDVFLTNEFAPYTVVSARELHLIVAEARLAEGDMAGFREHVNAIRVGLDGLTAYEDQIPALQMLRHERQVNLFLENRRLFDLYRFGEQASSWQPNSHAVQRPGTFFPISLTEIQSNPEVGG